MSPLFDDMYNMTAPNSSFDVYGMSYRYVYYLVEWIYLERISFVNSLYCPNDRKNLNFMIATEKAMKDVRRGFDLKNFGIYLNTPQFLLPRRK